MNYTLSMSICVCQFWVNWSKIYLIYKNQQIFIKFSNEIVNSTYTAKLEKTLISVDWRSHVTLKLFIGIAIVG